MMKKTLLGLALAVATAGAVLVPKPAEAYWVGYGWHRWHPPVVVVAPVAPYYGPARYYGPGWAPAHYWVRAHYTPWGRYIPGHWN